jgi:hypothetical protein
MIMNIDINLKVSDFKKLRWDKHRRKVSFKFNLDLSIPDLEDESNLKIEGLKSLKKLNKSMIRNIVKKITDTTSENIEVNQYLLDEYKLFMIDGLCDETKEILHYEIMAGKNSLSSNFFILSSKKEDEINSYLIRELNLLGDMLSNQDKCTDKISIQILSTIESRIDRLFDSLITKVEFYYKIFTDLSTLNTDNILVNVNFENKGFYIEFIKRGDYRQNWDNYSETLKGIIANEIRENGLTFNKGNYNG